jgi:hypothetical protein
MAEEAFDMNKLDVTAIRERYKDSSRSIILEEDENTERPLKETPRL